MGTGDVDTLKILQNIGLSESKAKETVKNNALTQFLLQVIAEAEKYGPVTPQVGVLVYHLASRIKSQIKEKMPFLVPYICSLKIDSTVKLEAAFEYLLSNVKTDFKESEFEEACGAGVVISPEQIEECIEKVIVKFKDELLKARYRFNTGLIMQEVRQELKWADGKAIKNEVDMQVLDILGPKTEEDKKPIKSKPAKQKPTEQVASSGDKTKFVEVPKGIVIGELMKTKVQFHKVGENYKTDGYVVTSKTKELLAEHLKITGGKVRTRFPPEPNGILHIGHAKAININFGYAAAHDGVCFLRYDDTNPEKEEEKFFIGIKEMVEWLGYKPYKITYSSDNFDRLYELAVELIKRGHAYVCHQKAEDIKGFNPPPSPWRNRSVAENLKLFEDMKNGKFDEGEATLRMKVTLEEGKEDPVAYRIKYVRHHRTGDKWCIYPTYDYTHCLCDSIENITHSLCTKEFQSRRSSYYWLCNALDVYCPVQWEYGRLSVNYTVTSKRKIAKLISEKIVNDWDDPRLFTLSALRRRGFPPEAINNFCITMGITGAIATVDPQALEACVRDILNIKAPRRMVVLDPLKVVITNFPEKGTTPVCVPNFPDDPSKGSYTAQFDRTIFIERSDFKEENESGYRRLTKTQSVGLRHAGYVIHVKEVIKDAENKITELKVECQSVTNVTAKPKAFIHWVSNPININVRIFEPLFRHKNPDDPNEVPGGFLSDCNKESLNELESLADVSLGTSKCYDTFQFERIGFFTVDKDSSNSKLVFNKTVSLKESA
ncbi:hypothetical protein RUM44_007427 [Polyplax serrata]|uniref:glutamine--tRNA ligase n=1 Tax=Polyplax serrata TaxID=468196 RepID=A0ABR1B0P7_POLSC